MKNIFLLILLSISSVFINKIEAQSKRAKTFNVHALYLSDSSIINPERLEHYIKLTKNSEINSYVIDVKGNDGMLTYQTKLPLVQKLNAYSPEYDVPKLLNAFHRNHIRVIARIVCFNDPYLPVQKPEWAIKTLNGEIYNQATGETWLNPENKEVWKYLIDVAKECIAKGFDEIQFDYVRFPSVADNANLVFNIKTDDRYKVIDSFLSYARKQMPNAVLTADVFGIICQSVNDPEHIGQNLEYVGKELDYISPMIYPSLYAKGQIINSVTFPKPDLDPYGIVYNTLLNATSRMKKVNGYRAKIRPYLQAYTASWLNKEDYQLYGAVQLRQQIKAAHDAGCDQWIFWNLENKYPEDAFLP